MRALISVLFLASLAACGSSSGSNDAADYPKCSAVWSVGSVLPNGYDGCLRPDGNVEAPVSHQCNGVEVYTYGDTGLHAAEGKPISDAAETC